MKNSAIILYFAMMTLMSALTMAGYFTDFGKSPRNILSEPHAQHEDKDVLRQFKRM